MKSFKIYGTPNTPEIIFDVIKKELSFNGMSLPEYGGEFYDNVESHLPDFFKEVGNNLTVIFNISYMNTTSNKRIYHIFKTCIKTIPNVKFIWKYSEDDDDMKEQGEIFEHGLGISFEYQAQQL